MDELVAHEFEAVRIAMKAADDRLADHIEQQKTSLALALDAMDKRLAGMNELRGALTDLGGHMATRREMDAVRDRLLEKLEQQRVNSDASLAADVEPLRAKLEALTRPNWVLITSCLSVLFVLVTGAWLVTGLKIDQSLAPVALSLEQTKVSQAQLAERTRQAENLLQERASASADIANLKTNYSIVTERLASIRSEEARMAASLVEIETQFCGQDNLRSQIHAQDLRTQAMIWKKIYGEEMPIGNAFYARVGRCGSAGPG